MYVINAHPKIVQHLQKIICYGFSQKFESKEVGTIVVQPHSRGDKIGIGFTVTCFLGTLVFSPDESVKLLVQLSPDEQVAITEMMDSVMSHVTTKVDEVLSHVVSRVLGFTKTRVGLKDENNYFLQLASIPDEPVPAPNDNEELARSAE